MCDAVTVARQAKEKSVYAITTVSVSDDNSYHFSRQRRIRFRLSAAMRPHFAARKSMSLQEALQEVHPDPACVRELCRKLETIPDELRGKIWQVCYAHDPFLKGGVSSSEGD